MILVFQNCRQNLWSSISLSGDCVDFCEIENGGGGKRLVSFKRVRDGVHRLRPCHLGANWAFREVSQLFSSVRLDWIILSPPIVFWTVMWLFCMLQLPCLLNVRGSSLISLLYSEASFTTQSTPWSRRGPLRALRHVGIGRYGACAILKTTWKVCIFICSYKCSNFIFCGIDCLHTLKVYKSTIWPR